MYFNNNFKIGRAKFIQFSLSLSTYSHIFTFQCQEIKDLSMVLKNITSKNTAEAIKPSTVFTRICSNHANSSFYRFKNFSLKKCIVLCFKEVPPLK